MSVLCGETKMKTERFKFRGETDPVCVCVVCVVCVSSIDSEWRDTRPAEHGGHSWT